MLKAGEQKSIFDIAKVIGNIRTDLIIPPVEEVIITVIQEEVEEDKPKEKTEKKTKKTDTL